MRQPVNTSDCSVRSWSTPLVHPTLATRDVHVWLASLQQPPATLEHLWQLLSVSEQARADRFHFERDRQYFVAARGFLRLLLGRYLVTPAAEIEFSYAKHGKPRLATSIDRRRRLDFNLAHSGALALYAFTRVGKVGVDLEHIRAELAGEDIARRFFSPSEVACLSKLPRDERCEAFFNCWTRKEAIIKAKGVGLSLPLDQFDVTLAPTEPAALLRTRWDENEASRWSLKAIEVDSRYAAALAVRGFDWQLSCFNVSEENLRG